jgi:dTDP-4-amino-4,6-dideoxygalactose transaminase
LSNHGRHRDAADHHIYVGNNRRLDALQAAILSAKMPHLERWNAARRRIAGHYEDVLAGLPIKITKTAPEAVSSHHLAVIQVPERDKVKVALAAEGISTGIHYRTPCHRQPAFAEFATRSMPVSERAANRILSLPMFPHLSEAQIQHVGDALRRILSSKRLDDLAAVASDRFRDAATVSPLGLGAS